MTTTRTLHCRHPRSCQACSIDIDPCGRHQVGSYGHLDCRGKELAAVTTVTVGEGVVVRKYEQTASRDHDVTLIAGTYPLSVKRTPEGLVDSYWASIPAVAHDHWASTVELGGVALAGEQRGGEEETYSLHVYAFAVERTNARGNFLLA